jgi:hypothetical protein
MSLQTWRDQFNYPLWVLLVWVQWAVEFAVFEYLGVRYPKRYPTLTYLCITAVPTAILAAFCGWLVFHFTVQYQITKGVK